jgi:hypothetical protein
MSLLHFSGFIPKSCAERRVGSNTCSTRPRIIACITPQIPATSTVTMPAYYGIVKNIHTYNPIRIAFHEWAAMLRDLWAARSWREALGLLFGPPGWRPGGRGLTSKDIRSEWNARHLAR